MKLAATNTTHLPIPSGDLSSDFWFYVSTCAVCIFGIFANLLAMFILQRARSRTNKGYVLMLRCLFTNDCMALTGKLVRTFVIHTWPSTANDLWMCRVYVLCRFFVCGSACVAAVMGIDRWLALTKPFFYEKHNTFGLLKRTMVILWLEILCLVCAPFVGFGLYWDEKSSTCEEIHKAQKPLDVLYAFLYVIHGVIFAIIIIYTNLAVMKALCMKDNLYNAATKEEKSLVRLMLMLCIGLFTFCFPKLLTSLLTRYISDKSVIVPFSKAADVLLVTHIALDPCLYVLLNWRLVKFNGLRPKKKRNANDGNTNVSISMRTIYNNLTPKPLRL